MRRNLQGLKGGNEMMSLICVLIYAELLLVGFHVGSRFQEEDL